MNLRPIGGNPWAALLLASAMTGPLAVLGVSYNNEWAAEIPGGLEHAREVADHTGCSLLYEVIPESDIYLLRCHHVRRRSTDPHDEAHTSIEDHKHVTWTQQQQVKSRQKRQGLWGAPQPWRMPPFRPKKPNNDELYIGKPYEDFAHLNDEKWSYVWYLNRGGGLDMNVQKAWQMGITGKDVVVTILDDGVERMNPDIVANYDPEASYDVNDNDGDPTPRYDMMDSNRHGTRCAGEVSASANNSFCGVGIAYNSKIGGVRMLDGDVTDAIEARAVNWNNQHIDIYSASWGPDDDGKTVDGPGPLATRAFINGIVSGRKGKGSIFVWASGNGGKDHDNCNCDGYTNSIWTLSVSSATENGLIPWYSEACSSTMATTYSSGSPGERKVVTTDLHNQCTTSHTGTSASAPMAAGVLALVLEANPNLTWRDVQHITVRNCHVANLRATDWRVNAMGRNYSHSFGYGIMDAAGMVELAQRWTTAPAQMKHDVPAQNSPLGVPARSTKVSQMTVNDHGGVNFLEHVQAKVSLRAQRRGDVKIALVSPSGTRSQLLDRRPHDSSPMGFQEWPFLTVFTWGENPAGVWQLEITNEGRYQVTLVSWSLTFFGTSTDPESTLKIAPAAAPAAPAANSVPALSQPVPQQPVQQQPVQQEPVQQQFYPQQPAVPQQPVQQPYVPQQSVEQQEFPQTPAQPQGLPVIGNGMPVGSYAAPSQSVLMDHCLAQDSQSMCARCEDGFFNLAGHCVADCPQESYFKGKINNTNHCVSCFYTCRTCVGPNDYQCSGCFLDAVLQKGVGGEQYCHNKGLMQEVFSSSHWYYILSIGFAVNCCLVTALVCYFCRGRDKRGAKSLLRSNLSLGRRYMPVKGKNTAGSADEAVPFYDQSSDEERIIRPYSDNPAKATSYTDN